MTGDKALKVGCYQLSENSVQLSVNSVGLHYLEQGINTAMFYMSIFYKEYLINISQFGFLYLCSCIQHYEVILICIFLTYMRRCALIFTQWKILMVTIT